MWYVWGCRTGSAQVYTIYARTKPPKMTERRHPFVTAYDTKKSAVAAALNRAATHAKLAIPVQVNIQGSEK